MEKVVKCNGCGLHFMLTDKVRKCPFCKTGYVEVEEKVAFSAEASAAKNEKKEAPRTQKKSFKVWGKN